MKNQNQFANSTASFRSTTFGAGLNLAWVTLCAVTVLVTVCHQANAQDDDTKADKPSKDKVENVAGKYRLITDDGTTFGEISAGTGKPGDVFRWQPEGDAEGSPLQSDGKFVLSEDLKSDAKEAETNWPDKIFFTNKDTIPCRIVSINKNQVVFESFAKTDRVPHAVVKAVELSTLGVSGDVSCEDDAWQFSEEAQRLVGETEHTDKSVEATGENEIIVRARGHFGHATLASPGKLEFTLGWKKRCAATIEVREFVRGPTASSDGTGALLLIRDNCVMTNSLQGQRPRGVSPIMTPKRNARITLEVKEDVFTVKVNGEQTLSTTINPNDIKGNAISMNLTTFRTDAPTHVTLRDFTMEQTGLSESSVFVDSKNLDKLLTIPRLLSDNPPKQILFGRNYDLLRGELVALNNDSIQFRSRADKFTFDRDVVSSIVWLHAKTPAELRSEQAAAAQAKKAADDRDSTTDQIVQAVMHDGRRLTINATEWTKETLTGVSDVLGTCSIPIADIKELRMGKTATDASDIAYADWVTKAARAPKLADVSAGSGSGAGSNARVLPTGTPVEDFQVKMLDESTFKLSEQRGKVVVLDFWATWCGPCVRAMPEMLKATGSFDPDEVVFIAVNQMENRAAIELFLKRKEWKMQVALDGGDIGKQFGVSGIPHSVVIDKEGKLALVKIGATDDLHEKISNAIEKALK